MIPSKRGVVARLLCVGVRRLFDDVRLLLDGVRLLFVGVRLLLDGVFLLLDDVRLLFVGVCRIDVSLGFPMNLKFVSLGVLSSIFGFV